MEDYGMVGIQGIGGVPEPRPNRPASTGDHDSVSSTTSSTSQDGVVISSEAAAAARVAQAVQNSDVISEIRIDNVEAARQSIERGDFKNPDIVAQVAERISKLL